MKENKYYVPEINEFHVGFQYEYREPIKGEWWKCELTELKWFNHKSQDSSLSYPALIKLGRIRVKCLDKSDIESCGFKLLTEEIKDYSHWCHFKNNEVELHVQLNEKYFPRLLNIGSLSKGKFIGNFKINIKNKSELEQLLIQLRIK